MLYIFSKYKDKVRLLNQTLDWLRYMYMSILPFLHMHFIGQYDFVVKSLFEFSVDFLNILQHLYFIYMPTKLLTAFGSRYRLAAKRPL